jgi:hypothetical protein
VLFTRASSALVMRAAFVFAGAALVRSTGSCTCSAASSS